MFLNKLDTSVIYCLNDDINIKKYYVILFMVLLFLILLMFIPYKEYQNYTLYINDDNYKLVVDSNFFPARRYSLYINKKKYDYKLISIDNNYLVDNKRYYEISIDIKLDKSIIKSKNILNVKVLKKKTTVMKKIINELKG